MINIIKVICRKWLRHKNNMLKMDKVALLPPQVNFQRRMPQRYVSFIYVHIVKMTFLSCCIKYNLITTMMIIMLRILILIIIIIIIGILVLLFGSFINLSLLLFWICLYISEKTAKQWWSDSKNLKYLM